MQKQRPQGGLSVKNTFAFVKTSAIVKTLVVFVLIGFCSAEVFAQSAYTRYPVHVQVVDPDKAKLKRLVSEYPELIVDHVSSLGYEIYGSKNLLTLLKVRHLNFVPVVVEVSQKNSQDYPSPEQTVARLLELHAKYPKLMTTIEIGKSVQHRSLMFARLTAKPDDSSLPEFKYIANMHGDEIVGRELMVKLIEDLTAHYGSDPRITSLMDHYQIYILPSMNPDGAAARTRFNANGVDLNRSFPDFTTQDNENTPNQREPEIQAIMNFQATHHFKLSANFHGGSEVVNYPWDAQEAAFPLDDFVKKISLDYAEKVPYIYQSTQFEHGITNGFQWYQVLGGMQDWSYHYYNDIQLTIELTQTKWPSFSTVDQSYQLNRDSLLGLIEEMNQL